jgi:hypothetical protein
MSDHKAVYFDRSRAKGAGAGKWVSQIKKGPFIATDEHESEAAARNAIGLEGGSLDRFYQPPDGETGREQVDL